jgi:hypothetical protein
VGLNEALTYGPESGSQAFARRRSGLPQGAPPQSLVFALTSSQFALMTSFGSISPR